jgi:hypothetical protein
MKYIRPFDHGLTPRGYTNIALTGLNSPNSIHIGFFV